MKYFMESLVADLSISPQKPVLSFQLLWKKILAFIVILSACFFILFLAFPPAVSFETLSWNAENFMNMKWQVFFLVLCFVFSAICVFFSGVPGFLESISRFSTFKKFVTRASFALPFIALIGWVATLFHFPAVEGEGVSASFFAIASEYISELSLNWELACFSKVFGWAAFAVLVNGLLLRSLVVTNTTRTALFASLASFAFGALIVLFQCPYEVGLHHFVWHSGPLLVVALLNSFVIGRVFKL